MTKFIRLLSLFCVFIFASNAAYSAGYMCDSYKQYTSCNPGFYMTYNGVYNGTPTKGNKCTACPTDYTCAGGTADKVSKGTTCAAGTYWNGSACETCTGGYYCSGFANVQNPATNYGRTACPNPTLDTYKRSNGLNTAPFYNAKYRGASLENRVGVSAITGCTALVWYNPGDRAGLYEYVKYSSTTSRYENTESWNYMSAAPGWYLTSKTNCGAYAYYSEVKECEAGYYCPGKSEVACNSSNQATVHTTTFGREGCPSGSSNGVTSVGTWLSSGKSTGATSINDCIAWSVSFTNVNCGSGTRRCYYTSGSGATAVYSTSCYGYEYTSCNAGCEMTYNGTYNSTPQSGNACTACAAGKYKASAGTAACTVCTTANTYSAAGAASCSTCTSGYSNSGTTAAAHANASSCTKTITLNKNGGSGTIQSATGTTNASITCQQGVACNFGSASGLTQTGYTFKGGWGTTASCTATTTSFTTPTTATYYACKSGKSITCSAGYYLRASDASCAVCTAGKYCNGGTFTYNGSDQGITGNVSAGYYSSGGGTSATPTAAGNGCLSGYTCGTIAAGRYGVAGATSANGSGAVSAGYYSTGGATSATPTAAGNGCLSGKSCGVCTSGYSTGGATASTCTACTSGYATSGTAATNHDAASDCTKTITLNKNGGSGTIQSVTGTTNASITCQQGVACNFGSASGLTQTGYTFKGWGTTTTCTATTTSFTTPTTATYYACKTANSYTCSAGYYLRASDASCQSCPAGKYCNGGTYTYNGYDQGITGDCAKGTYSSGGATTSSCTGCPTSYTTAGTGTTSINSCYLEVACGYYRSGTTGTTKTKCAAGTYKAAHNAYYGSSDTCTTVDKNYFATAGACSQTACNTLASGLFPNTSGTGSKSSAYCLSDSLPVGSYINVSSSTSATKVSTCTGYVCPGGVYSYRTGAVGRLTCPTGSYASNNKCVLCGAGYTTTGAGATSCVTCQSQYPTYQPAGVAGGYKTPTWSSSTTTGYTTSTNSYGGTNISAVGISNRCKLTTCTAGYALKKTSPGIESCMSYDSTYDFCMADGYYIEGEDVWQEACTQCVAGTYKSGTNGTQYCTVCNAGMTSDAGAGSCKSCSNESGVASWTATTPAAASQWNTLSTSTSIANKCSINTCSAGYTRKGTASATAASSYTCEGNCIPITLNQGAGTGGTTTVYKIVGAGGGLYSNNTCTTAATITPPTKANATFVGYFTSATSGTQCIEGNEYERGVDACNPTAATTLYAQYDCNTGWRESGTRIAGTCIGAITATASTKTLTYNGSAQSCANVTVSVPSSGATVTYCDSTYTSCSTNALERVDSALKNVGSTTIYYKVTATNYAAKTGSYTCTMNRAPGSITAIGAQTLTYPTAKTVTVTRSGDGAVSCTSGDTSVVTCSASGTTLTLTPVKVGSATITVNVAQGTNHNATSTTFTATVNAGTITTTKSNKSKTYDGSALTCNGLTVSAPSGTTIKYCKSTTTSACTPNSTTVPTVTNVADSGTVYYSVEKANYTTVTGNFTCTVNNAAITATASTKSLTYNGTTTSNGTAQSCANVSVTVPASGASVTYSTSSTGTYSATAPTLTTVGSTTVYYKVNATNYTEKTGSYTCTMGAKAITASASNKSLTYNGSAQSCANVTLTAPTNGTIKYCSTTGTTACTPNSTTAPTLTNTGSTTVYYTVEGTNFTTKTATSYTCTMNRANGSITSIGAQTLTYPTAKTVTVTRSGDGAVSCTSGDANTVTCSASGTTLTLTPKKTGSATITVNVAQGTNHNATSTTFTATVNAGTITATASNKSLTYNGTTTSNGTAQSCGAVSVTAPSSGSTVKYCLSKTTSACTPDSTTVPSITAVADSGTVYYSVTATNYTTKTGSYTCTMGAKAITASASNKSLTYNGSAQSCANVTLTAPTNGTIKYCSTTGTTACTPNSTTAPTLTNTGSTTVYYTVEGTNFTTKTATSYTCTMNRANGSITSIGAQTLTYPTAKTVTVTRSGDGAVSCTSGDTSVVTCSASGTTLTLTPVKTGSATITVNVAQGTNHNATSTTFTATVNAGTITTTESAKSKTYDGSALTCNGVTVTAPTSGATIKYGTASGTYNLTSAPTITNVADSKTIYYQVTAANYTTKTGSFTCTVSKATCTLGISATTSSIAYPNSGTFTVSGAKGAVTVSSNATTVATTSISGTTVTNQSVKPGSATITVTDPGNANYNGCSKTHTVTVTKGTNPIALSASSGSTTFPAAKTFTVSGAQGTVTVSSSATGVATVAISGTTVTMTPVATGSATITATAAGNDYYNAGSKTYALTVNAGTITTTESAKSKTYDGSALTCNGVTVTAPTSGATIKYGTVSGTYNLTSAPTITNVADSKTIYYQVTAANYTTKTGSFTCTVNNATITATASNKTLTYNGSTTSNGSAQSCANVTGVSPSGASVTYSTSSSGTYSATAPTLTNVGSTTVYYKITATNYTEKTGSYTCTMGAKTMTVSASDKTLTYTGSAQSCGGNVSVSVPSSGASVTYSTSSSGTYGATAPTLTNAGSTTVYYKVTGSNFTEKTGNYTCTMNKAANPIALSASSGSTTFPAAKTFTVSGAQGTVTVSSSATGVATVAISGTTVTMTPVSTGSATITVTAAGNANYNAGSKTYALTVNAGTITTTESAKSKTYDGNALTCNGVTVTAPTSGATIKYGTVSGTYNLTSAPTITNVADSKTIYYQVTAANYTTKTGSFTCTVNNATITATASTKSLTYNGSTTSNGSAQSCANVSVTVPSSGASITYSTSSTGTYSATAPTLTNVGSTTVYYKVNATNYAEKTGSYTCTMGAKAMTVSASDKTLTYTGSAQSCANVNVSVPSSGASITYSTSSSGTYGATAPTLTNAGSTTVYYRVTGSNFTEKTGNYTCTMNKAACAMTLSATSGTMAYSTTKTFTVNNAKGTATVASSNTNAATVAISGATVTMTSKAAYGTSTITVTDPGNSNYEGCSKTYALTVNMGTITLNNQSATTAGTTAIYQTYNTNVYSDSARSKAMTASANGITVPTRTGYTFGGYYESTGYATQYIAANGFITSAGLTAGKALQANGTWYAKWTANGYTVTYKAGTGGSGNDQTQSVTYNASFTTKASNTFTKANATFAGWSPSSGSYTAANTAYTYSTVGNVTLTATWNCNAGYTLNSSTGACYACADGTYKSSVGDGACSACNALGTVAVTGGTYSSVSPRNANTTCRYVAPAPTKPTYCATKTSNTISYNGSAWGTNIYSVTANSGSIIVSNNTKDATCSQCGAGTVSTGGTKTSCDACSDATKYQNLAGQSSCKTPDDGYYKKDNTSQQVCGTGYFCKSGTRTACTTYGTGYTTSETTASVNTRCYLAVSAGKVRSGTTGTTLTTCAAGTAKAAHNAYYGTNYSCDACTDGYYSGAGASSCSACSALSGTNSEYTKSDGSRNANTTCYLTTTSTKYVATPKAAQVSCVAGSACAGGVKVYYGSVGGSTACTDGYYSGDGASSCSACSALNGTNSEYTKSDGSRNANTTCYLTTTSTKYVATAKAAQATCAAGGYCPGSVKVYYGSTGGRTACDAGKYNTSTGSSAASACTACANGTYSSAGAVSCTDCPAADNNTKRTTFPDEYYPYNSVTSSYVKTTALTIASISKQTWSSGGSSISGCRATYRITNAAATFSVESVGYNTSTGKYDVGGSMYYSTVNAGYYLDTKYSDTYCNTSTNNMLYKRAIVCPANSYCAGGTVPKCSTGTHESEWGKTACPAAYGKSAAGSSKIGHCYLTLTPKKQVASAGAGISDCSAGKYCTSTSDIYYNTDGGTTTYTGTACVTGSYSGSGASACTACQSGKTTSAAGQTSCNANCSNAANVGAWKTATWNTNNTMTNLCTIDSSSSSACTAATKGTGAATATYTVTGNACVYSGTCNAKYYKPTASGATVSCTGCPTAYPNSASGNTSTSDAYCYVTLTAGKQVASAGAGISDCSAGKYCTSTANIYKGTAGGTTTYTGTQCDVGTYSAAGASVCTACSGATQYQNEKGQSSCKNVSTGYYKSSNSAQAQCPANYQSGAGASAQSGCQASCSAGTRVATANAACTSPAGGWWTAAHSVNYGNVSPVNYCMDGWTSTGTAASNHDAKTDCTRSISGGQYVPTSTIPVRYIKFTSSGSTANTATHLVEMQAFASSDGTGTNLLSGKTGTGSNIAAATDGSWSRSNYVNGAATLDLGSIQNLGSLKFAAYTDGRTYSNVVISVSTDNSTWTTVLSLSSMPTQNTATAVGELVVLSGVPTNCSAGTYKAAQTLSLGSTSSCASCAAGTYSTGAASACTACQTGSYQDSTGQSVCKPCAAGKTNTGTGNTAACTTACTAIANIGAWATTSWSNGTVSNLCTVSSCAANSYKSGNACPTCSSGTNSKYTLSAAGTTSVNSCYLTLKAGQQVASAGAGISDCSAGKYCTSTANIYYGTGTTTYTGTTCVAGSYSGAGASACTSCGAGKTSTAGATAASACTACSGSGVYAWTASTWNSSNNTMSNLCTVSTCSSSYYKNGNACSACSGLGSGFYPNSANGNNSGTNACKTNNLTGQYVASANATSATNCGAGKYKAAHQVAYGSTSSCDTASAGYFAAGPTSGSQTQCVAGSYSAAGASACTACGAGKTSTAGATASSACTSCTAIANLSTWATSTWNTNNTMTNLCTVSTCDGTSYKNGNACPACPSGYTANTSTGKTAASQCQISVTKGHYIGESGQNSSNWGTCANWTWKAAHTVNYGSKSSCDGACPAVSTSGGWSKGTGTGWGSVTDCYQTKGVSSYCSQGSLKQNATSTTAWGTATEATAVKAKAGSYVSGSLANGDLSCTQCGVGTYQGTNGSTATSCTAASKGYYVSSVGASSQTACAAGTYTSSTGQSSCTDAAAGTYTTGCGTNNTACTGTSVCAKDTWSDAKKSSCTACTTSKGYRTNGDTAAAHAGLESCKVTCGGGSYVSAPGAGCVNVGAGYWGAGGTANEKTGTIARTACASGLTTIGYGAGANEAADCGRILNVGSDKIYLRSVKKTTPSLNVKIGDTTYYGNMTSGALDGYLIIKDGNVTYRVHDDSK